MIPNKGQYVKIIFRNATQAEGVVETWTDQQSVLRASDGESLLVINRTAEDVMAYKIVINHTSSNKQTFNDLTNEFQETYEQPSASDLRLKKLGQLRGLMVEQEKHIIANKLREHVPSAPLNMGARYGHPFIKKPRTQ
jgi:hypothetical protein